MRPHAWDPAYVLIPQIPFFPGIKAAVLKNKTPFPPAGTQIPLSAMGKSDWQRRGRKTPNLQVCGRAGTMRYSCVSVSQVVSIHSV